LRVEYIEGGVAGLFQDSFTSEEFRLESLPLGILFVCYLFTSVSFLHRVPRREFFIREPEVNSILFVLIEVLLADLGEAV
jgi:hypothetical protein